MKEQDDTVIATPSAPISLAAEPTFPRESPSCCTLTKNTAMRVAGCLARTLHWLSRGLTMEPTLVEPSTDLFQLGRFNVFPWDTSATIAAKLAGWYSWAPRCTKTARLVLQLFTSYSRSVAKRPLQKTVGVAGSPAPHADREL